jgi:vacuolar-type H+-ATPase subunit D/Vma8
MLAPNKQNLLLSKSQKKLVQNGHKLLKEKRSGLILTFLEFAQKGRDLELKVSKEMEQIMALYSSSLSFVSSIALISALLKTPATLLQVTKKRISGVYVDEIEIQIKKPKRTNIKKPIQKSLDLFAEFFPLVLELSQLKINTQKIAKEIKKTSAQISNLERKIESIEAEIKFIENTLNEKSNLEKATLIKIFK